MRIRVKLDDEKSKEAPTDRKELQEQVELVKVLELYWMENFKIVLNVSDLMPPMHRFFAKLLLLLLCCVVVVVCVENRWRLVWFHVNHELTHIHARDQTSHKTTTTTTEWRHLLSCFSFSTGMSRSSTAVRT